MQLSHFIESFDGLKGVKGIVDEVLSQLNQYGVSINEFGLRLVLTEALNNAVIHGNQQNKGAKVGCTVEVENNVLSLQIENQGLGFDWQQALDESSQSYEQDAFSEGGRGFVIYRLYGFEFKFKDSGRLLMLTKVLD